MLREDSGEAEITQLERFCASIDQQVLWFDVAVHYGVGVAPVDRLHELQNIRLYKVCVQACRVLF